MSNFRHTISPVGGRGVSDRKHFQNCFKVVSAVVQLLHVTKCNNMFLSEEIRRYEGNVYLIFAVFFCLDAFQNYGSKLTAGSYHQ